MKRRLIVMIAALLVVAAFVCCAGAESTDFLDVKMDLSRNRFSEPATITVNIRVTNIGEDDTPGPVSLYDPGEKLIEEFGESEMTMGASKTWTGQWRVTQSQLEAGALYYSLKYYVVDDEGQLVRKTKRFGKTLIYEQAVPSVEVNRTITPTTAGKGQEVSVTYEVINTGTVDITDVKITENKSVSNKAGTIDKVAAGEKESYTFTVKMGTRDLTSNAQITYSAGGKKATVNKEAATIRYGEMKLSASVSADKKGGLTGDNVKLTVTLKNSGKEDYNGITVSEPTLGDVFTDVSVPAGGTVKLEKEVPITVTTDYQFTVAGQSESGLDLNTATDRITVTAIEPTEVVNLTVNTTAAEESVHQLPGDVAFTVSVTNTSGAALKDVSVVAGGMTFYTFPQIEPGETREFTRTIAVSMAGTYQFSARVKNQLGETQTFPGNTVYIRYAAPTPVPTEVPIVTPPAPVLQPIPEKDDLPEDYTKTAGTLRTVGYALLIPVAIGALLIVIGLIGRTVKGVRSMSAVDHLQLSGLRDYEAESRGRDSDPGTPDGEEPEEAEEPPAAGDPEPDGTQAGPVRRHRRTENSDDKA